MNEPHAVKINVATDGVEETPLTTGLERFRNALMAKKSVFGADAIAYTFGVLDETVWKVVVYVAVPGGSLHLYVAELVATLEEAQEIIDELNLWLES